MLEKKRNSGRGGLRVEKELEIFEKDFMIEDERSSIYILAWRQNSEIANGIILITQYT